MGQLESYNINETILSGLMLAIFITYFAETLESSTFESFKGYKYSANFASSKICKIQVLQDLIFTPDNAGFKSYKVLPFTNPKLSKLTKLIDDYSIWQDQTVADFKIDENVLLLQRKYNLE
jgi:hypothetical protein